MGNGISLNHPEGKILPVYINQTALNTAHELRDKQADRRTAHTRHNNNILKELGLNKDYTTKSGNARGSNKVTQQPGG